MTTPIRPTPFTESDLTECGIIKTQHSQFLTLGATKFEVSFIEEKDTPTSVTVWLTEKFRDSLPESQGNECAPTTDWDECYFAFRYKWSIATYIASVYKKKYEKKGLNCRKFGEGMLLRIGFDIKASTIEDIHLLVRAAGQFAEIVSNSSFKQSVLSTAKSLERSIVTSKISSKVTGRFSQIVQASVAKS